jgi:hypothetical protein
LLVSVRNEYREQFMGARGPVFAALKSETPVASR